LSKILDYNKICEAVKKVDSKIRFAAFPSVPNRVPVPMNPDEFCNACEDKRIIDTKKIP